MLIEAVSSAVFHTIVCSSWDLPSVLWHCWLGSSCHPDNSVKALKAVEI